MILHTFDFKTYIFKWSLTNRNCIVELYCRSCKYLIWDEFTQSSWKVSGWVKTEPIPSTYKLRWCSAIFTAREFTYEYAQDVKLRGQCEEEHCRSREGGRIGESSSNQAAGIVGKGFNLDLTLSTMISGGREVERRDTFASSPPAPTSHGAAWDGPPLLHCWQPPPPPPSIHAAQHARHLPRRAVPEQP